jgi:AP-2 complex subunit mu-1
MANAFKTEIINGKDRGGNPVVNLGMCSFMYTREQNVYVVAVTRANANAMLAFTVRIKQIPSTSQTDPFHRTAVSAPSAPHHLPSKHQPHLPNPQFMHSLINLFKSYFNKFNEKTLKSNFVIIYELLDEVCDNGYPQITSPEVLKAFITQRAARAADDPKDTYENQRKAKEVSMQVTGAVQWRGQNLVYKKNEVYLDIVESVSLLMSPKGVVLKASATGTIEMKTALSGMPELTIGLNDKVGEETSANQTQQSAQSNHKKNIDLADLQFHQCVNLSKFASEKTISFVPPDGKFDLMKYRVTEGKFILTLIWAIRLTLCFVYRHLATVQAHAAGERARADAHTGGRQGPVLLLR